MPTDTTGPIVDDPQPYATLHLAFDIGNTEWTFASTPAVPLPLRVRTMTARDMLAPRRGVRGGPAAPRPDPGRADLDVLRSGAPRLLVASRPRERRFSQCDRRLGQHRGESRRAPSEDRSARRDRAALP